MNKDASTSTSPTTDTPVFAWGEGHPVRFSIADLLTKGQFAAQTIVLIDSCFTQAVDDADMVVLQAYELSKVELLKIFEQPSEALEVAQDLAVGIVKGLETRAGCG